MSRRVSLPWLVVTAVIVVAIWGNSMVPGVASDAMSHSALDGVRSALEALGIPAAWLTNFLIRKTGHVLEYALLGAVVCKGVDPDGRGGTWRLGAIALTLVLVPAIDETIQLFVPGRSGMVADVCLDLCGAAVGAWLARCAQCAWRSRKTPPNCKDGA